MTPQEKAESLVDQFKPSGEPTYEKIQEGKKQAHICVDQLIESWSNYSGMYDQEFFDAEVDYWKRVKTAIDNL